MSRSSERFFSSQNWHVDCRLVAELPEDSVVGVRFIIYLVSIAIALAAQAVLADLFAAVAIYVDKPFVVGDMIKVGDFFGTVERIGFEESFKLKYRRGGHVRVVVARATYKDQPTAGSDGHGEQPAFKLVTAPMPKELFPRSLLPR